MSEGLPESFPAIPRNVSFDFFRNSARNEFAHFLKSVFLTTLLPKSPRQIFKPMNVLPKPLLFWKLWEEISGETSYRVPNMIRIKVCSKQQAKQKIKRSGRERNGENESSRGNKSNFFRRSAGRMSTRTQSGVPEGIP